MSQTTSEINRVTTTIISLCIKVIVFALVALLMYEGVTRGYHYGHEIFDPAPMSVPPGRSVEVVVQEGEDASDVARNLKRLSLIEDELIFRIQARFYEYDIHPGAYTLNTSMNSKEMLKLIDENNKSGGEKDK